ncbi:CD5 antigen-like [Thalassophryne amazonica]|uniref:CD5 antigen-like n=1 Tax=Thalassophryne amazonica TaxID=390379 RepID=UPI0014723CCD|nr:CD5 antigen-like [Thalassophryne amazonica]
MTLSTRLSQDASRLIPIISEEHTNDCWFLRVQQDRLLDLFNTSDQPWSGHREVTPADAALMWGGSLPESPPAMLYFTTIPEDNERAFPSVVEEFQPSVMLEESVRLVHGSSLCSGRLQVKLNQSWSSVCEDDFDQQDAQVVCRELGCGPPSVVQGALYEEIEPPKWTKVFHCRGNESGLLACGCSGSDRNSCSPGKAVGLTCSEPVRLVGGASGCAGTLEVKVQEDWRPVEDYSWTLETADVVCRDLDCGSAVYTEKRNVSSHRPVWEITYECVQSGSALRECVKSSFSSSGIFQIICSDDLDNLFADGSLPVWIWQPEKHLPPPPPNSDSESDWTDIDDDDYDEEEDDSTSEMGKQV